uniref:Uncharacterized protein n=1 Tax=Anguilla anguilla TaxID=7936 RepID=A0A0E9W1H0_ANGAN
MPACIEQEAGIHSNLSQDTHTIHSYLWAI